MMGQTTVRPRQPPQEPVLDMAEIQGIAIPGFLKPHQTLLYLRLPDGRQVVDNFKEFLGRFAGQLATAVQTLDDRRRHRQARLTERPPEDRADTVLVALGFSYIGLRRLTPGADEIPDAAFRQGLVARSALLGDPTDPASEGHPLKWVVGAPGAELDALIVVAGNTRAAVTARAEELAGELRAVGLDVASQDGDVRPDLRGHEHFGFDDGVSQPGPRGLASNRPGDYITERHIDLRQVPEAWLYGYPGQDLVWPGEFVLGYPATSPDPLLPGPDSLARPSWTHNGAFLVYRRLRQDVGLFWRTMHEEAMRLAVLPGFSGLTDDMLAARLVGRWPSGAPVNRVPLADDPKLGGDRFASNNFRFDSDTPPMQLRGGRADPYPQAKADPAGVVCPWAAHIRKVNTRDSSNDMGAREATYSRRILRISVPFGNPLPLANRYAESAADPEHGNRGLLFLAIQASIERQFEFLQARWANDPSRPKMPGGNDMVIGQNAVARDGIRRCAIFGSSLEQAEVRAAKQWVIPTGGGYFFVPSVSALSDVVAR
jgi:Dyp-type peroxidase family